MISDGGDLVGTVALGSSGDVAAAVRAASAAAPGWAETGGYQRGLALYRVAELLQERRAEFTAIDMDAVIDLWLWYVGWADKLGHVGGLSGRVGPGGAGHGPCLGGSGPVPVGVVGVVVPDDPGLIGLVASVAPAIVAGNAVVALVSERCPVTAAAFATVLAASALPPGVVNIVTGRIDELAQALATHPGIAAVDLCGINDPEFAMRLAATAMIHLKRTSRRPAPPSDPGTCRPTSASPMAGIERIASLTKAKTVSPSIGL